MSIFFGCSDRQEAVNNGILDQACEPDAVMEKALNKLKELCELPAARYKGNKLFIREDAIQAIHRFLHG